MSALTDPSCATFLDTWGQIPEHGRLSVRLGRGSVQELGQEHTMMDSYPNLRPPGFWRLNV